MADLPLGIGAYSRAYAQEPEIHCLNRFFEQQPTNKQNFVGLIGRPPNTFLYGMGEGPIRANFTQEGTFSGSLFTVSGPSFFQTTKAGVRTNLAGTIAGSPDGAPSIAGTAKYVFVADGTSLQFYDGIGSKATTMGLFAGQPADGDTATVNGQVYVFKTAILNPYDVKIGDDFEETSQNFADAINAWPGTVNIAYPSGTDANIYFTAGAPELVIGIWQVILYANTGGTAGNAYVVTEAATNFTWSNSPASGGVVGALMGSPTPDDVGITSMAVLDSFVLCLAAQSQRVYFIRPGAFLIDPLDFFEAESTPDEGTALITVGDQVWITGAQSTDAYYLSGDSDAPFARFQGRSFSKGALEGTPVLVNEAVVVVGNDGIVYSIGGSGQERISTHAIEEQIRLARDIERDS